MEGRLSAWKAGFLKVIKRLKEKGKLRLGVSYGKIL